MGWDREGHHCAGYGCHVAGVFHHPCRKPGVGRETQLLVEAVHVREIRDVDAEERRTVAVRFHEIIGSLSHVEQQQLKRCFRLAR